MVAIADPVELDLAQEDALWNFICDRATDQDRDPAEIVAQDFGGNRRRYLQGMIEWFDLRFCASCRAVFSGRELVCSKCAILGRGSLIG